MVSTTWVPIATFIAGVGSSQFTEYLKERRTLLREAVTRQEVRALKRIEFQRTTLLSLQDSVQALLKSFSRYMRMMVSAIRGIEIDPGETAENLTELQQALGEVGRFQSRILSVDVRELVTVLRDQVTATEAFSDVKSMLSHLESTLLAGNRCIELIGQQIRSIDVEP